MKSLKVKLCLIFALAFAMVASLGAFFGLTASANRYVTLSGTSIFNTSGDARVWAHRVENEEDEDEPYYYTMFTFEEDDDAVSYRRNLAYKWFYNVNDEDDYLNADENADSEGEEDSETEEPEVDPDATAALGTGYLHMEIGFEELNFKKFTIIFETQQYEMTKDEKTINYVIFVPAEDGEKVYAIITNDTGVAESDEDYETSELVALDIDHIIIQLGESGGKSGEFSVEIYNVDENGEPAGEVQDGVFENVGKMYARYVSSSTKPVTPLTFKAEFEKDEDGKLLDGQKRARMALYNLNGQSFVLNRNAEGQVVSTSRTIDPYEDEDGETHYEGGQVNDTQPPVLCLDTDISYVKEGSELSFSYTAVDVLTQSPSTVTGFFMLTNEQLADGVDPENYGAERLFRTVTSDDDIYMNPAVNHYLPVYNENYGENVTSTDDNGNTHVYGTAFDDYDEDGKTGDFTPVAALKIYIKLTDTASTGGQSTYVFLDWFVEDQYKLLIDGHDYIAVASDKVGATYNYGGGSSFAEDDEQGYAVWSAYNEKVQKAAKDLRAGSDDFYLPSIEELITDNATGYKDMTYSIYYIVNGTTSSSTGKSASQLSISLNAAGKYEFTVYATDSSSNKMWYYDEDGEKVEFEASEIWNYYDSEDDYEGLHDKLPWFKFEAGISKLSVEDPGEQDTAYQGTTYTASAFDYKGVGATPSYSLYRFNQELYAADHDGEVLTYQQFMEEKQTLFEGKGTRKYFTNIIAQTELDSTMDEYEEYNAYAWNPSARTFIPQEANAFYLIKCEVSGDQQPKVVEYMGIASSATPRSLKGEDTWLQDNMTSIILLSIAGAALIGIILLLVIKPKDKGDIDVQFEQEISAKKAKKSKSK